MAAIIEFEGLAENLIEGVRSATENLKAMRSEVVSTNDAIKKGAQESAAQTQKLGQTIEATAQALTNVNKAGAQGGFAVVAKDIDAAAKASDNLSKSQKGVGNSVEESRRKAAEAIATTKGLTTAQKEAAAAAGGISKEYAEIVAAGQKLPISPREAAKETKSLREQLRASKEELDRIIEASDGKITPELIEAAKRAGELKDRFGDLNATVDAFNPDAKFRAFTGVLSNLASGAQAAVAGLGLFGKESDDVSKALLKIQQATAFFQGLQGFIGGLADNLKNVRLLLVANTATTRALAVAEGQAAVGAQAQAVSTGFLATAMRTARGAAVQLFTVLAANPIGIIVAAVAVLVGTVVALTNAEEDAKNEADSLLATLDKIGKSRAFERNRKDAEAALQNERQLIEEIAAADAKRAALPGNATEEQKIRADAARDQAVADAEARKRKKDALLEERALRDELAEQREREAEADRQLNEDHGKALEQIEKRGTLLDEKELEDIKKLQAAREEAQDKQKELLDEINRVRIKASNDALAKESADTARAIALRVQLTAKATEELAKLSEDLARRKAAAELQNANPLQRVELQRAAATAELKVLEDKLKTANLALTGSNKITEEQEKQLAVVRLSIQAQYEKDVQAIQLKEANDRIALIEDTGEQERAAFDAQLAAQVKTFKEAGATEIEIAQFVQRERDKFRGGQVEKAISQEEAIANARIDAMEKGAESEIEFERRKEALKLDVREEFAKERLAQIKDDTSKEAELTRLQLEGVLREVEQGREKLKESAPTFDLFSLLGIDLKPDAKARVLADISEIGQAIQQAASANIASQIATVEAQVSASDAIIDDQRRRRDELQGELDRALEEDRAGRANNSRAIIEQIEATKAAEAAALEEKKRQLAEQRRLAQQQVLIDAAGQASALALSVANLIKTWSSLPFGVGLVSAFAQAATIIGTFASIRAKVKAAAADVPQFRKGASVEGLIEGSSHEQGGIAMFDRRTGKEVGEMEGREFIVNSKSTQRFRKTIEAINEGDMPKIQQAAIKELMLSANVQLDQGKVKEIVRSKETVQNLTIVQTSETNKALLKRIDTLTDAVESFKTQERIKPQVTEAGGKTTVRTPTRTVTKR